MMLSLFISAGVFLAFAFIIMIAQLKPMKRRRSKELDLSKITNVIKLHNSKAPAPHLQRNVNDSADVVTK
jgi:hypothetical protein